MNEIHWLWASPPQIRKILREAPSVLPAAQAVKDSEYLMPQAMKQWEDPSMPIPCQWYPLVTAHVAEDRIQGCLGADLDFECKVGIFLSFICAKFRRSPRNICEKFLRQHATETCACRSAIGIRNTVLYVRLVYKSNRTVPNCMPARKFALRLAVCAPRVPS